MTYTSGMEAKIRLSKNNVQKVIFLLVSFLERIFANPLFNMTKLKAISCFSSCNANLFTVSSLDDSSSLK